MTDSAFDTSDHVADVLGTSRLTGTVKPCNMEWGDLTPFMQGYILAMMRDVRDLDRLTDLPPDDRPPRVGPYWVRFSDLAPETLTRIIADCEAAESRIGEGAEWGRYFWAARQSGLYGGDPKAKAPPLTVTLCDDGKVRFQEAAR